MNAGCTSAQAEAKIDKVKSGEAEMPTRRTIVITRNGETTAIRGWRAWLLGMGLFLAVGCALALIVFVLVDVAITVGLVLVLLIPVLAVLAILGSLVGREP